LHHRLHFLFLKKIGLNEFLIYLIYYYVFNFNNFYILLKIVIKS
jgi:hypothetical protein